jgi:hypothetical protein
MVQMAHKREFIQYPYLQAIRFLKDFRVVSLEGQKCYGVNDYRPTSGIVLKSYAMHHGQAQFEYSDTTIHNIQLNLFY